VTGEEGLEHDRAFLRRVLAGVVTPDTHPWAFDEDVVQFAVARVEQDDPAWLLAQLADRGHPFDGRANVVAATHQVRAEALAILRRERPDYLR